MEREILIKIGDFSNSRFTSSEQFTIDDWKDIEHTIVKAKELFDKYGVLGTTTKSEKPITDKQKELIKKKYDTGKEYKDLINEFKASINKELVQDLTTTEASTIIDLLIALEQDLNSNKVEDVSIMKTLEIQQEKGKEILPPENKSVESEQLIPEWVTEQEPLKCKNCGCEQFTLKTGIGKNGTWYAFACDKKCGAKLVFVNESKQEPVKETIVKTVKDIPVVDISTKSTPPKISSKSGVPEWAMNQFINLYKDEIMNREFEYIQYTGKTDGKVKYAFKSVDGKGGSNGWYYVNPPQTQYDI